MISLESHRSIPALLDAAQASGLDLTFPLAHLLPELELGSGTMASLRRLILATPHQARLDSLRAGMASGLSPRYERELRAALSGWCQRTLAAAERVRWPGGVAMPEPLEAYSLHVWASRTLLRDYLDQPLGRFDGLRATPFGSGTAFRSWVEARAVLLAAGSRGDGRRGDGRPALAAALRRTFEVLAAQVAEAVAEEAALASRVPADPRFAPAWSALSERRAALRAVTHPVAARVRAGHCIRVRPDPTRLEVESPASPVCTTSRGCLVVVELEPVDGEVAATCRCPGAPPVCPARLAAVDVALDVLADPAHPQLPTLRRLLSTSPWERTVDALMRLQAADAAQEPLGWRLVCTSGVTVAEPAAFRRTKDGRRLTVARVSPTEAHERARAVDLEALHALGRPGFGYDRDSLAVARRRVLSLLVGHPLVVHDGERVSVVEEPCALRLDGSGPAPRLLVRQGRVDRNARAFLDSLESPVLPGPNVRFEPAAARLVIVSLSARALRLLDLLCRAPSELPHEALPTVLATLSGFHDDVPVELDAALRGERLDADERLEVRLAFEEGGAVRASFRVRPLPGGPAYAPGEGPPEPWAIVQGRGVYVHRDIATERARHAEASERLPCGPVADAVLADPEIVLLWLERLHGLPFVDLTWDGTRRWRLGRAVSEADLRLRARDGRSWFALDGSIEVDGDDAPLSVLLAAVRERRTYVQLGAERWARLSDRLRAQIEALARGQNADGDAVELGAAHLPLVDGLVREGARLDADEAVLGMLARLRAAGTLEVQVPAGLRADLRPYQRDGYGFLARLARWAPGAFLADDMGLGKTVQALALLLERAPLGPALVIAPTSVGFGWIREAERFAPGLRTIAWRGPSRAGLLGELTAGDVLVTSYDLAQRGATALAQVEFATLVLDEAQAVKNAATKRWKAVAGLKRGFAVALSGTPIENRLDELWALCALVVPGLFGGARDFRTLWATPVERARDDAARQALSRRLRPFLLRRTKAAVTPELPDRVVVDVVVPLSPEEGSLYHSVRKGALVEIGGHEDKGAAQRRIRILAALTALRRVACHPALHDPSWTGAASKLERVRELVAELREEGHRALLFSQFTSHLALVRAALEADGATVRYLDGSTPEATRRAEVDAFQRGEGDVFLISLKAGGTGLNLTAATYVLHLDPWWNPAVEDQATDRAHRIGQTRAVTVYRIVAGGTVEEQILTLHEAKRELVAGVLEGTDVGAHLGTEELFVLLVGSDSADSEKPAPKRPRPAPTVSPRPAPAAMPAPTLSPRPAAAAMRARSPSPRPAPAAMPAPTLSPRSAGSQPAVLTLASLRAVAAAEIDGAVEAGVLAASSAALYRRSLNLLLRDAREAGALAAPAALADYVAGRALTGLLGALASRVVRAASTPS